MIILVCLPLPDVHGALKAVELCQNTERPAFAKVEITALDLHLLVRIPIAISDNSRWLAGLRLVLLHTRHEFKARDRLGLIIQLVFRQLAQAPVLPERRE